MRRAASLAVMAAVVGIGLTALAVELWPSDEDQEAGSRPEAPSDRRLSRCRSSQLRLALETLGGTPVIVLRHVSGASCNVGRLRVSVRIRDQRGEPVPVQSTGKTFAGEIGSEVELIGDFVYLAACGQQGPLRATVTAGTLTAHRTLPIRGCIATQSRVIRLGAGRDARFFLVQAPDPARHTFSVRLRLPRTSRVAVSIQTTGPVLHILDRVRRRDCRRQRNKDVCVLHFPTHEAPSAGQWTVQVEKRSRPPATVRFRITFEAVR
jgi:hypothetical protein